jgi:hypothetical protein
VPTIAKENRPIAVAVHPQTFSELVTSLQHFHVQQMTFQQKKILKRCSRRQRATTRAGMFLST